MTTHVPLHEVKAKLSAMVSRAQGHEEIVITVHGKPAAVLVDASQFHSMRETLDVLSDPESARELLFGDSDDGSDYVAPAGATPEEILNELRSRHGEELMRSMSSVQQQVRAAADEARHAADSARKSAVRASVRDMSHRRSTVLRTIKSGTAKLRARREARKTAADE